MKLFVMAGSLRRDSLNKKLARALAAALAGGGAEVDLADFREFELPVYDGDLEAAAGLPPGAAALVARLAAADGLVLASPEYNASMPGAVKNAIDWASRARPWPARGKPALLASASPGAFGGNRALWTLRVPLEALGTVVYPEMLSVPRAPDAFDEEGRLRDAALERRLAGLVEGFLRFVRALRGA